MPRRVFIIARKLALFLLFTSGGAIINIGIAWGCAAWPLATRFSEAPDYQPVVDIWERSAVPVPSMYAQSFSNLSTMPMTRTLASAGELRAWGVRARYAGGTVVLAKASPPCGTILYLVNSGWPAHAFQGERWDMQPFADMAESQPAIPIAEMTHVGCVGLWRFDPSHPLRDVLGESLGERIIPLRPLWPGFALNTLLYAAILFALIRGPFIARRTLRRRRGLCVSCGYDLRGRGPDHAACPECGAAC
jgi:hypothetical protein